MLEDVVNRVQQELGAVKLKSDMKDLKLQEATFAAKDAEGRLAELEQRESFNKQQTEKLSLENSKL